MITTIIISQFWGILSITLGVMYLFKKDLILKMIDNTKDEKFSVVVGFMSLILGVATFLLANGRHEILLKVIALLSFVKGISLMAFPTWRYKIIRPIENRPVLINVILIIIICLGLYLLIGSGFEVGRNFRR